MGFKRGALLGPLELLHSWISALILSAKQASVVCLLKARGSQRWAPCGGHPGKNVSLRLFPRFIFWHPCCWAPLLLGARRDAYLVQGGNPPRLVFSGGRAPSCGRAPVQLRQVCNHPHSLAHRFTFTFCWSTFIIVIVLIISDIVIIIMLLKSLI